MELLRGATNSCFLPAIETTFGAFLIDMEERRLGELNTLADRLAALFKEN
jgi:hypothetical protein